MKSRDEIILQFASLHPRRMELANILSKCRLRNQGKGPLGELKSKKFPVDPGQACTFSARLGKQSVFIIDPCLQLLSRL